MPEDEAKVVKTVGELILYLQTHFAADTEVVATWEGVFETVAVVRELWHGKAILVADGFGRHYNDGDGWY